MGRFSRGQAMIEKAAPSAHRLKGQAMMEYLVTYGWMLLALFIVLALLLSSGAFSASNFSVEECTFQPDLPCPSYIISNTGGMQFVLTNGMGFPIKITGAEYKGKSGIFALTASQTDLASGQDATFTGSATSGAVGQFDSYIVTIKYRACRDSCGQEYTTSGRISAVVAP